MKNKRFLFFGAVISAMIACGTAEARPPNGREHSVAPGRHVANHPPRAVEAVKIDGYIRGYVPAGSYRGVQPGWDGGYHAYRGFSGVPGYRTGLEAVKVDGYIVGYTPPRSHRWPYGSYGANYGHYFGGYIGSSGWGVGWGGYGYSQTPTYYASRPYASATYMPVLVTGCSGGCDVAVIKEDGYIVGHVCQRCGRRW